MDFLKTIVVSAVVVALGLTGYAVVTKSAAAPSQTTVGSLTGPDIPSPYLKWGGLPEYQAGVPLIQGASTTCAIQSPAATSTLISAGIRFDLASSSAAYIELGKSVSAFATTTSLGIHNLAAGAQATILASSTAAVNGGADPATVFAPNTYFTVKIGGGGSASVPTGICFARFLALPS